MLAHLRVIKTFPAASRALQFDLGRAARSPMIAERTDIAFIEPVRTLLVDGAATAPARSLHHPRLVATAILGAITTTGLNALTPRAKRPITRVAEDLTDFILSGVVA